MTVYAQDLMAADTRVRRAGTHPPSDVSSGAGHSLYQVFRAVPFSHGVRCSGIPRTQDSGEGGLDRRESGNHGERSVHRAEMATKVPTCRLLVVDLRSPNGEGPEGLARQSER